MTKSSSLNDWNKIVYLLSDFIKSMEEYRAIYGTVQTEEVSTIYDKELELILALKAWMNKNKTSNFKLNTLNEKEKLILLETIDKSKRISLDNSNQDAPFTLTMFMPLVVINENSPQIDKNTLAENYKAFEKVAFFKNALHGFLQERISSNLDVISDDAKLILEVHEPLSSDLISDYLNQGVDLYDLKVLNKYKLQLNEFYPEDLLHSILIPVVLRSSDYSKIADFSYNNDGLYFDMIEDMVDDDINVSEPWNLDDSLIEIENLKWDMLSNKVIGSELTEGAVLREAQYTVIKHKDQFVKLEVQIEDLDEAEKVLQSFMISRSLFTKEDYINSLPISFTSESFIFNVGFVQITDSELSELEEEGLNIQKFYENSGLDETIPPGTVFH